MAKQIQYYIFVETVAISATKKKEAQMLNGILWHLKATYVTLEFAALTHLILMKAWAREGSGWSRPTVSSSAFLPF